MVKKILIGLLILLLAAVSLVGYFYLQEQPKKMSPVYNLMPSSTAMVIKVGKHRELQKVLESNNLIWQELKQTPAFKHIATVWSKGDSLLSVSTELNQHLRSEALYLTLHKSGAENISTIGYISFQGIDETGVVNGIKQILKCTAEERAYEGHHIYTFNLENGKLKATYLNNTLLLSAKTILLEDAVRHFEQDATIGHDPGFKQAYSTIGNDADAGILLNYEKCFEMFPLLFNNTYTGKFSGFAKMATWSALDLRVKPGDLRLNGFTYAPDSVAGYLNIFNGMNPEELEAIHYMPYNTDGFIGITVNNYPTYRKKYLTYLKSTNQLSSVKKKISQIEKDLSLDLQGSLDAWLGNEFTVAYAPYSNGSYHENILGFFKIKDETLLEEFLQKVAVKKPDNTDILFNPMRYGSIFGALVHPAFNGWKTVWYIIQDDFLVIAPSKAALQAYQNNYVNGRTLHADQAFQQFYDNVSESSNVLLYSKMATSYPLYKQFIKDGVETDSLETRLKKFEGAIVQFSSRGNGTFYNNIYLKYNPSFKENTNMLWAAEFPNNLHGKPYMIKNYNNETYDIVVQDDQQFIYLIDSKGEIRWNRKVDGYIMGDIKQVDVYKNGKLQMLFNTANAIYLIDRNGNDVEKFPIRFPDSESGYLTSPVTVLDYENNRNYRILVATKDQNVFNYDITGTKVDGWDFAHAMTPFTTPFIHKVRGGKDYILNVDMAGNIRGLERKGVERLNNPHHFPYNYKFGWGLIEGKTINDFEVVAVDTAGIIFKQSFAGKRQYTEIKPQDLVSVEFKDVNGDHLPDYLIKEKDGIKILDHAGDAILEADLDGVFTSPQTFKIGDELVVGYTNSDKQEVQLFHLDGTPYEGFPVSGTSPFVIGDFNNDEQPNMAVFDGNRLLTYTLSTP